MVLTLHVHTNLKVSFSSYCRLQKKFLLCMKLLGRSLQAANSRYTIDPFKKRLTAYHDFTLQLPHFCRFFSVTLSQTVISFFYMSSVTRLKINEINRNFHLSVWISVLKTFFIPL